MEADLPAVPEKSGDVVVRIDSQGSTPRGGRGLSRQ